MPDSQGISTDIKEAKMPGQVPETHRFAWLLSPNIFDYSKLAALCDCKWQSEWQSPDDEGRELARAEHWAHRMEVAPPGRVRLSRAKGYRKPAGAIVVARPSKWGNDFPVGQECTLNIGGAMSTFVVHDRQHAVNLFESWQASGLRYAARKELRGHDLACWCPLDEPCHADVLLKLANVA